MPVNSPLDEGLANTVWLHTRHAIEQARAAATAASDVDGVIRDALDTGRDAETIADASFVDVDLVRHVASGGSTADYLRSTDPF
jgi:hypothetical protein